MQTIKVVNVKCGGCAAGITEALEKEGMKNVSVNLETMEVSFEGDAGVAKKKLSRMGYPEAGSDGAGSLLNKGKSYISCALGKIK